MTATLIFFLLHTKKPKHPKMNIVVLVQWLNLKVPFQCFLFTVLPFTAYYAYNTLPANILLPYYIVFQFTGKSQLLGSSAMVVNLGK